MKAMLTLSVAVALTGCATMGSKSPSVTLEFRSGSQSPGLGLTEMTVPGLERPVYVSDDVLLSNADVESARVASAPNGRRLRSYSRKAGQNASQPQLKTTS